MKKMKLSVGSLFETCETHAMTPLHFDFTVDYSTVQFPFSTAHKYVQQHLMALLMTTMHHPAGSTTEIQSNDKYSIGYLRHPAFALGHHGACENSKCPFVSSDFPCVFPYYTLVQSE